MWLFKQPSAWRQLRGGVGGGGGGGVPLQRGLHVATKQQPFNISHPPPSLVTWTFLDSTTPKPNHGRTIPTPHTLRRLRKTPRRYHHPSTQRQHVSNCLPEITTLVQARQKLESQFTENTSVQKVHLPSPKHHPSHHANTYNQEFQNLPDDAKIYKLVGPVLLKQDTVEAKGTVEGRLEYIGTEMYASPSTHLLYW